MSTNTESIKQSSFYLHSKKNRCLYPSNKYPLTHLLDYQSLQRRSSKQPSYVTHFKHTFIALLSIILFCAVVFQTHIHVYNSFFGPFHFNLKEFLQHVKNFENGQSWFKRIEYIQIELGENNIQNPVNSDDTIRRYADPITRRNYIATYKKIKKPSIYVKLPVRSQTYFHKHHSFDFSLYSIRTLQCIAKNLQLNSETTYTTWIEKSEYLQYINEEYSKNSTRFNMLVLSKCGVLIGYLYRPIYEKAFLPTREYTFYENDIALEMTRPYFRFYPLVFVSLIFSWFFLKALFYLIIYLLNKIRFKFFDKYGFLSFPLELVPDVLEELWLLDIDEYPHKQLLQLDEMIQQSQHKFNNQLFIIQNDYEQLFVVLFQTNLYEKEDFQDELSPFNICPVTDIRKIVQYGGVCYGEDSSWIPWPVITTQEENYSEWLHAELMELSEHYKKQYEHRVQHESGNECQPSSNTPFSYSPNRRTVRRRRKVAGSRTPDERELRQLIREEENLQRLKLERLQLYDLLIERTTPASPQFIANFRMQQKNNENLSDSTMQNEQSTCMICLEEFQINDPYSKWPCPSTKAHIFHDDCMLNMLRTKNTCPICRHPIEAGHVGDSFARQLFTRLVL